MRVTAKKLVDEFACSDAVLWFKRRWLDGCEATLKNLTETAERGLDLLYWFVHHILKDRIFEDCLASEEQRLYKVWEETVELRHINYARQAARIFIRDRATMTDTIHNLRKFKRDRESSLAALKKDVTAKLARMVYDKIKSGAGKKRRAK